ncbi:T9SS type A sorting domain-containing protein, partial [Reichenbachiella sp.]|uniref:T9SS type A sorting domain-containing protein n=3 Tax=Reichenbachiella sp. TaxID=2184521 RepID=UPI003299BA7A
GGVGYQYYPVDFSNFEPGKGYWFLTSRPSDFSLKGGSAVEASDSEPFTIQLRANDWNMIGNPYPFAIDWQAVIDYNANKGRTVEKLVTYTNRQYNSDQTTLNKYGGALLHSSTDMEIQIPVSARSSSTGRIRQTQNRNNLQNFGLGPWVLGLGLKNESMVYQVSSISMKDGAETGIDSYDWKMLPRLSSYLDISFGNEITKSVVPIADQFTWDFSVNSNLIGELTALSWDNYGLESSDYALMLLDVKDKRVVDMGKRNFYQFKFEETSRPFKLFYASKSNMTEYMNLESNFVGDPFPNPFSNILTIPVSINGADATVQINVYNILGKEVYQSIINRNSSGYHEFNIDLTEGVNTNIKAGTYLMLVTLFTDSGIQLINKRILFSK